MHHNAAVVGDEPVALPRRLQAVTERLQMTKEDLDPGKVVIHDFLSEECAALVQRSESLAYERATVANVVIDDVRNNERVLLDDAAPSLPTCSTERKTTCRPKSTVTVLLGSTNGGDSIGISQGRRSSHIVTGHTCEWSPEASELTFTIYLNDAMTGGDTRFSPRWSRHFLGIHTCAWNRRREWRSCSFIPSGTRCRRASGRKYVLRTDVMYEPKAGDAYR